MNNIRNCVVEAVRAFERGEIVVVTDDNGRENEGDLVLSAMHCTPEKMAFIVRYTSGIVCAAMPAEEARRLNLTQMVAENDSPHSTAFTVSVDYRRGTTTGISAHDRTLTVRNLASSNTSSLDFVRPGHIFPLVAREGGVLIRSGHTEAAVDLCRLAGLAPVGVLCELLNDDGTVMRGPQITSFAMEHKLSLVTIADLVAYRQRKEMLVEHVAKIPVETVAGPGIAHTYQLSWETIQHVAIVIGDIGERENIPVWLHHENVLNDVFCKADGFDKVLRRMKDKEKRGVLVYLRERAVCAGYGDAFGERGLVHSSRENHAEAVMREEEWRQVGLGAQILKHLGLNSIVLLISKEQDYAGFEEFGIRITRTEIM